MQRKTMPRNMSNGLGWASACILLCGLAGCSSPPASSKTSGVTRDGVARTEIDRGPIRVSVEVSPEPARLSDEPTLTLTIDHEQGVRIQKPPFGDAVGDFIIRDFYEPLTEVRDEREIVRQVYTLEPTFTGLLRIDPIAVMFIDERPGGDGAEHVLETEALTVTVLSVLDSQAPSLDDLDAPTGPVALPASYSWLWWSLGMSGGLLVAVAFVGWWLMRERRATPAPPPSPRELAHQQLDQLWEAFQADGDVKHFYVRLTDIVRRYIEDFTGLHAPERTTEEFLREIGSNDVFTRDERARLKDFLESADLVKFAAHRPGRMDVEAAYARARRFVGHDTREDAS